MSANAYFERDDIRLFEGSCLDVMRDIPSACVDALVTDPPAGIAFMGNRWDSDRGGRAPWVEWMSSVMVECLRVLKPGAHGLVWALPRTSHWTACALEDAGFEVRDRIAHVFGSGFPKSLDISKAIDKAAGAEREVVGERVLTGNAAIATKDKGGTYGVHVGSAPAKTVAVTAASTPEAKHWTGWGTALKPAVEDWWLVRKPIEGTVAENVCAHGVGGLNIDGCRIGMSREEHDFIEKNARPHSRGKAHDGPVTNRPLAPTVSVHSAGRWPANIVMSHSADCRKTGTRRVKNDAGNLNGQEPSSPTDNVYGHMMRRQWQKHGDADGFETIDTYDCAQDCPIAAMDRQSGELRSSGGPVRAEHASMGYGGGTGSSRDVIADCGGASRFFHCFQADPDVARIDPFFYCAKVATSERNEAAENRHPTVKPIALMRHLVRLITPRGGLVLDPFAGSGTTGLAAHTEGARALLIELEREYAAIARARIADATRQVTLFGKEARP